MRLDLNVLWIDDQPKSVASYAEALSTKLSLEGFELVVTQAHSLAEIDQHLGGHVHEDGIDLVLVDYDLGKRTNDGGEEALVKIREKLVYRDLIFYSAVDVEKLREIAYRHKVDGIYLSTRVSLVEDAFSVITNLIRKVMDIDHMRGVVMSATSDIDYLVEETLLALNAQLDKDGQALLLRNLATKMRTKLTRLTKEMEKAVGKNELKAVLKQHATCTSSDRLTLLIEQLESRAHGASDIVTEAKDYQNGVLPRRNDLAHVMLQVVEGRRALIGRDGEVTADQMTILRRDLIKHRDNFRRIAVIEEVPLDEPRNGSSLT